MDHPKFIVSNQKEDSISIQKIQVIADWIVSERKPRAWADPEGGTGGPDPPSLKNLKNIRFFNNTGPDPLKNQASIQCWAIICLPVKHLLNGVSLAGR